MIIITVGASIFLRGLGMIAWGKDPFGVPAFSSHDSIEILGAALVPQSIWIVAAAILLAGGIHFFLKQTLTGKAMVACAVNKKAAWLTGIPSETMAVLAFGISTGCGAVAGIFIAPITMSSYDMGTILGLKGFCAAMIGGIGSLWGAFAGGLLLGILESMGAGLISSGLKDAIAFILLLLILYIRPGACLPPGRPNGSDHGTKHHKTVDGARSLCRGHTAGRPFHPKRLLFADPDLYRDQHPFSPGTEHAHGYAGQVSLGHAAFYGIGAYTTAILSGTFGISPWLALIAATGAAVLIAFVVGLPTLKLSGYYLGMGTLGFGMIVNIVFREGARSPAGRLGLWGFPPWRQDP